jgi:hypothetical protein
LEYTQILQLPNIDERVWADMDPEQKQIMEAKIQDIKHHNEIVIAMRGQRSVDVSVHTIKSWEDEFKKLGISNQTSIDKYIELKLKSQRVQKLREEVTAELGKLNITDPKIVNKYIELMIEKKYGIKEMNANLKDLQMEVSILTGQSRPYLAEDEPRPKTIWERNQMEDTKKTLQSGLIAKELRVAIDKKIYRKKIEMASHNRYGETKPVFSDYQTQQMHVPAVIRDPQESLPLFDPQRHGVHYITRC